MYIPLCGKTDNRSNFMAFLTYRAEADSDLQQHLKSCPRNVKYTSHYIQNELINLLWKPDSKQSNSLN